MLRCIMALISCYQAMRVGRAECEFMQGQALISRCYGTLLCLASVYLASDFAVCRTKTDRIEGTGLLLLRHHQAVRRIGKLLGLIFASVVPRCAEQPSIARATSSSSPNTPPLARVAPHLLAARPAQPAALYRYR